MQIIETPALSLLVGVLRDGNESPGQKIELDFFDPGLVKPT